DRRISPYVQKTEVTGCLQQPQAHQLCSHLRRHVRGIALGEIGRRLVALKIAPALEGPAGLWRGRDDRAPDLDPAVFASLLLIEVLLEADQLLTATDDATHYPVKRAAVQQLLHPLGHVGGIYPVGGKVAPAALC